MKQNKASEQKALNIIPAPTVTYSSTSLSTTSLFTTSLSATSLSTTRLVVLK